MVEAASNLVGLKLLNLLGLSLVLWCILFWQGRGKTMRQLLDATVPARARDRPFWTPADLLLMVGTMFVLSYALRVALARQGWIAIARAGEEPAALTATGLSATIVATSLGGLAAIVITLNWLRLFHPEPRRQLGLTCSIADVKLGLGGAVMILPPVMMVSAAASYFVPYEHPVLESLTELATPGVFLVTFVGIAIVTPVVEEFLVRGLLQGSLQGLADRRSTVDEDWVPQSYWPVLVASAVFACLHLGGQGAAAIPLFVLALGLGYLYRQTGSLAPPIIVHMLLNGTTLTVEYLKLNSV